MCIRDSYYTEEMIKDLIVTDNTKGELTIPNVDRFYELIAVSYTHLSKLKKQIC